MVDRIQKALDKLSGKEKQQILTILEAVRQGKIGNYDIKKLKGRDDIFRIRKGRWRIIYRIGADSRATVLAVERRTDTTYKFL